MRKEMIDAFTVYRSLFTVTTNDQRQTVNGTRLTVNSQWLTISNLWFVPLVLLFLLTACSSVQKPYVVINDVRIHVEIATTSEQWQQGLMYRESLPENEGMLFVFPDEQQRSFWMKNTLIPLDMLFLDRNKKVIGIFKDVQPCKNDPCPTYGPIGSSQYVLEVNAGFAEKNNVREGLLVV